MEIVLPVLGVAFAAVCVWGLVRTVNAPKRCWLFVTRVVTRAQSGGSVAGIFFGGTGLLMLWLELYPAVQPSHSIGLAPWAFYCLIVGVAFVLTAQLQE